VKAVGDALGHTGRLQPFIDAIHAVVALYDLSRLGIPLGGAPRACRDAALAAHAKRGLNEDNAVFGSLLHCSRRACGNAPRILAVKARHEDEGCTRYPTYHFGADRDDLIEARPYGHPW
jgi:hypothetical protein